MAFLKPMPDTIPLLVCLVVISGCALAMTVTMVWTARDLSRTLHRVNAMLPSAEHALRDVHRVLGHVRRLLARANQAARHVETVVHQACETAEDVVGRFGVLKEQAQHSLKKWLGNGAGAGPRRHYRNGRSR